MNQRHILACTSRTFLAAFALGASLLVTGTGIADEPKRSASVSDQPDDHARQIAASFADLLRDVIPREYERRTDWGKTKRIPVGIQNTGHGLRLRLRKREKEVKHGVWKHYRVTMIEPEENLHVHIQDLRHIGPGRIGLTLHVSSKVHGWIRAKVYNRGVHVIGLTAEGDTTFDLTIDCEVGVRIEPASVLAGIVVDPVVTNARLKLDDFRLTRLGELHGPLVRELGDGLRHLMEDELKPAKLTKKLNRAIDKKRDRLRFSPDRLISPGQYRVRGVGNRVPRVGA